MAITITFCSDFGAQEKKACHCFHCFPIYLPWSDGTGCRDLSFFFWMLSFKPTFSLSSFTFIKRLFNSPLISAVRVVSFAYLRLLIFFLAFWIPACDPPSPAFRMMYSTFKLNKQSDDIHPWRTPFPILNQIVLKRNLQGKCWVKFNNITRLELSFKKKLFFSPF